VTIGDKKYVIQDPLVILAARNYLRTKKIEPGEEEMYRIETIAYREEIKGKWPELFEKRK
jgi:hypothetical protein